MTALAPDPAAGRAGAVAPPAIAAGSALLVFAGVQAAAWRIVGGFEYPLDDVYIHLAVAEQIAAGNYGVNPGEVSSPASSPLYPLLLVPFAGTEAQRLLPLAWNVAGLAASAALFARILGQAGLRGWPALALAAAAPLAANMPGLAATGMEHSLHMAASLALLSGLFDTLRTGRIGALLVAGVALAPALRPEGLALALAAAGAVAVTGRPGAGAGLAALGIAPQAAFAGFLAALGLEPMPSSVLTKLGPGETGPLSIDLSGPPGQALFALTVLAALAAPRAAQRGARAAAWIAGVAALAGAAHLLAGRIGWLNRYEPYAVAVVLAGAGAAVLALEGRMRALFAAGLLAGGVVLAGYYGLRGLPLVAANPLLIHLQQAQMARFAHEHARVSVAVNDLGRVSWTSPVPVLDLWGLASAEARRVRLSDPAPGWAGPLAERDGVDLAMIYPEPLADAPGPDWVRLGTLRFDHAAPRMRAIGSRERAFFAGGFAVAFYATRPGAVGPLEAALEPWVAGLPEGARFVQAPRP